MKQKNVGIIILSVLFILSLTCFIIGIINHNKDNDTDINNKNVSLDVNEKNNTNDTIDTNNTNDTNIDIENNTTEEFDNNEEYEDGIVYDEIIKEDTSNYNNKALICVKKYYKSYKTTEEGFDDYEYLLANDKTTSKQFYYSYYPITNKSGCGDTIKEIKIKGSIDNFKLFINNSNDDSGYADITEPIDNEFLAYFDDNTIKIYDMINEESYTTKASFKDYYIRNIVVKNNKPIKLILESDSINSIGMNTYNIHEISKSNYNYVYAESSPENENVLLYFGINGKNIINNYGDVTIIQNETKEYNDHVIVSTHENDYVEGFFDPQFSIYDFEGNEINSSNNPTKERIKLGELEYESYKYDEENKKIMVNYVLRYNAHDNGLLSYLLTYSKNEGKKLYDLDIEEIEKFKNTKENCNVLKKYKDEIAYSTYEINFLENGKSYSEKLASSKTLFEWIKEDNDFEEEQNAFKKCNIE